MIKKITAVIVMLLLITSYIVTAENPELKYDIFTYEVRDDEITITCVEDARADVVVPNKIDDIPVTVIASGAFGGSSKIETVYIPDSVKTIGATCFAYSTSIKSVRLSRSLSSISDGLFYQCSALAGVSVPYGVTNIGARAFAYCENLIAVSVPNSIKTIASNAFTSSKDVTIHCYLRDGAVAYEYAKSNKIPTEELIAVYVNDVEVDFDQPPITDKKKFRTLVPLRAVLEKMGAEIEWYNDMNYAGVSIDGNRLLIKPEESFMMVNGKAHTLSSPAIEYHNRIMLPIRDVVEQIGGKVTWDEHNKFLYISY